MKTTSQWYQVILFLFDFITKRPQSSLSGMIGCYTTWLPWRDWQLVGLQWQALQSTGMVLSNVQKLRCAWHRAAWLSRELLTKLRQKGKTERAEACLDCPQRGSNYVGMGLGKPASELNLVGMWRERTACLGTVTAKWRLRQVWACSLRGRGLGIRDSGKDWTTFFFPPLCLCM